MIKTKKLMVACIVFILITCCFSFKVQSQTTTSYLKTFEVDKDTYLKIPEINMQDTTVSYAYKNQGTEYQFNITLNKPLPSNIYSIPIETKGLTFYPQPPLDTELNLKEYDFVNSTHAIIKDEVAVYRPENVVNSLAVYKTNPVNGEIGKLYHIYAPLIIDAKGKNSYAKLEATENSLNIIINKTFLDSAVYPIIIDPTFGYTSIGTTTDTPSTEVTASKFQLSETGTVSSISVYLNALSGTVNAKTAIYADSTGLPQALIAESSEKTSINTSPTWQELTISQELEAGTYWLAVRTSGTHQLKYDSGASEQWQQSSTETYPALPDPFNRVTWKAQSRILSIYATYTTSATNPESVSAALNQPTNASTTTTFLNNFNYTPTIQGTDHFHNSSLIINGSIVASNSTALTNATINTIPYTFASNGTYLWNVQVYNSTHAVQATNNFTLTVGVYEAPEPTSTTTVTPTATTTTIGDLTTDEAAAIGLFFGLIALVLAVALPLAYRKKQGNND